MNYRPIRPDRRFKDLRDSSWAQAVGIDVAAVGFSAYSRGTRDARSDERAVSGS